ncbi:hypothetical protein H4R20_003051 [Coemansia guatemalensis]|uniref:HAD-like protein n=1 Tax=Coemansia guatemalensis TaxID=2761395 RepID=A0A9W8LUF4_9FUNG|nr:hypothetical protein H4R20_003051 [Coemansia guatemalensis]
MKRAAATTIKRALVLALDFDQTLTTTDTLHLVASTVRQKHPERPGFQWFTDKYMEDYNAFKTKWEPIIARHAEEQTVTRALLDQYLEAQRAVEESSLARISQHAILAGTSRQEFADGGYSVQLQPDAAAAINHFLCTPDCHVCVVSVNWSEDFVRGALEANGVQVCKGLLIYCNNPVFDSKTGLSTSVIHPQLVAASDKTDIIASVRNETALQYKAEPTVVYIGDSLTDLPALLLADVGLLVGQSASVSRWCKLLGIEFGSPRPAEGNKVLHHLPRWSKAQYIIDQLASNSKLKTIVTPS